MECFLTLLTSNALWRGLLRDAPFDIWGGGRARVFAACKLFFYLREKTIFFFGDQRPTIFFFMFRRRNFLSYAFPIMYATILVFFLVNIFFINFNSKLFFSAHIFNKLFFFWLLLRQTIYFNFNLAQPPPPPQISNGASLTRGTQLV